MFELFKSHTPKPAKGQAAAAEPPAKTEPEAPPEEPKKAAEAKAPETAKDEDGKPAQPDELGGPKGLEPTRYGDWERKGICYDF